MQSSQPCKVTLLHTAAWQASIAQVPCLSKLRQSLLKGLAGEIIECITYDAEIQYHLGFASAPVVLLQEQLNAGMSTKSSLLSKCVKIVKGGVIYTII